MTTSMHSFKRIILSLLAFASLSGIQLLHAQTIPTPSALRSYIETALEQNPDVMASRARLKNSDAKVDEATSNYIPHLSFVGKYSAFSGGRILYFPGVGYFNATALGIVPWDNEFQLTWPILNFGIWQGISASKEFRNASMAEVRAKELAIAEQVTEQYYNYAKASELVEIRNYTINLAKENLKTAQALFANDKAPKNDVLRAEVGVAAAEGDELSAKNMATLAQTNFNNTLKRNYSDAIDLPKPEEIAALVGGSSSLASNDGSDAGVSLPSLNDDAERAFTNRPELEQLRNSQFALEDSRKAQWSDYLPSVSFFGSYGWQETNLKFSSNADLLLGGLVFQWNLFSGFGTNARVQETEAQLEELRFETESATNGIKLELESARLDKVNAVDRLSIARKQLASAEENYRIVKAQYDNGLMPLITLIDAETTLSSAKANLTTTTYDVLIADAKYKKALGVK